MADELNGMNGMNNMQENDSLQGFANSWQRALQQNIGEYCLIDFLIGTQNLVRKEGILYDVGMSFITLYEPRSKNYIVCDFYSIKFVTFTNSRGLRNENGFRIGN